MNSSLSKIHEVIPFSKISVGLIVIALIFIIYAYIASKSGESDSLAMVSFYVSIFIPTALPFFAFAMDQFWLYFLVYTVIAVGIFAACSHLFSILMTDKTGMGVIMFSGFVFMGGIGWVLLIKLGMYVYSRFIS